MSNKGPANDGPPLMTVLAFDVGLKRTGVAVGQSLTGTAQIAGQLGVKQGRIDAGALDQLMQKWTPDRVVIGQPWSPSSAQADPHLQKVINRLKSHIQQHFKVPIIDWNEAYTSASANAELQDAGARGAKKAKLRDQLAACLMLEAYFDSL